MIHFEKNKIKYTFDFVLRNLLIVFFFSILIIYASREILDLDLWLHLKTGQLILETSSVPHKDPFSFTLASRMWINHEWLFQVISYIFYSSLGADGLILMQNIMVFAAFLLLFFTGIDFKRNNHVFVFIVMYLALMTSAYRFTIRPDIYSMFFLVLYLYLIKLFSEKRSNLIWLLALIQIIWVNMHGFYFLGPLILAIFLLSEVIKTYLPLPYGWKQSQTLTSNQSFKLLILLLLVVMASFVNPFGVSGASYPLSVLGQISGKGKVVFDYIQELAKPVSLKNIFQFGRFPFFKVFILLSLFGFRFNQKNINIFHLLLWLTFLGFALIAIRNITYFGLVSAFVCFMNYKIAFENGKKLPFKFPSNKFHHVLGYLFIGFCFIMPSKGAYSYLSSYNFNFDTYKIKSGLWGINEQRYPQKAVEFLLNNNLPPRLFNDFNSGSYLIGKTYPLRLVFIDGRTELYGPDFFRDYVRIGKGYGPLIEKIISRYNIEGFFISNTALNLQVGLLKYLANSPQWKTIYFDENAVIFLKNSKENGSLVKQFGFDLKDWTPKEVDWMKIGMTFRYPYPFIERAKLLETAGCFKAAKKEAKTALKIMPNNADALAIMANCCLKDGEFQKALIYARSALVYNPGNLEIRSKLALIYDGLSHTDKGLKLINSIIKNRPDYGLAYYIKAMLLKSTDPISAISMLKKAAKIQPEVPEYRIELGGLLEKTGDLNGARTELETAYEYDIANSELKKHLKLIQKK